MQQLSSQRLIRSNHLLLYSLIKGEDREAPTLRESSSMLHGLKPSSSGDIRDTQLIANSSDRLAEGSNKYLLPLVLVGTILTVAGLGHYVDLDSLSDKAVKFLADAGPYGYAYFALIYILAEVLAIPVAPLTASSGYLFGLLPGTLLVLSSSTMAASISFVIGRTFLRTWAQEFISRDSKWRAIDKAISQEGFKVVLLLRLSPLLPFALSNYLYAVTSVDFMYD